MPQSKFDPPSPLAVACAVPAAAAFGAGPQPVRGHARSRSRVPVNVVYGDIPIAVMMAIPADLEDFALGFSLTEGIIPGPRRDPRRSGSMPRREDGIEGPVDLCLAVSVSIWLVGARFGEPTRGLCGVEISTRLPVERDWCSADLRRAWHLAPFGRRWPRWTAISRWTSGPARFMPRPGLTAKGRSWRCARMSAVTMRSIS